MLNSLEKHIPLFEAYLTAPDGQQFLASLTDPTDKKILNSLTSNSTDIPHLEKQMTDAGIHRSVVSSVLEVKTLQHLNSASEFSETDEIGRRIKERYCSQNFNYSRPTTLTSNNPQAAREDNTPSQLTVASSLESYLTNKLKTNPQFIRQLNDYAMSRLSQDSLLSLPIAEKDFFLDKSGTLFHYSADFMAQFLKKYQEEKRLTNKTYSLNSKVLSLLTKQQVLTLREKIPEIDTNEDYIELWFNQTYSEPIRKFNYISQNLSKQQCIQKRDVLIGIVKELDFKQHSIIRSYSNQLKSQIMVLDLAVSDPSIDRITNYLQTNSKNNQITFMLDEKYYYESQKIRQYAKEAKIRFPLEVQELDHRKLVEDYLNLLFKVNSNNEDNIRKLGICMKDSYLRKLNAQVRLAKGQLLENADDYFSQSELQALKEKKEITLSAYNKKNYKVNDDVNLQVRIKNVKTIQVKVYELNLQKDKLISHAIIDDEVDLSFLFPTSSEEFVNQITNPFQVIETVIPVKTVPNRMGVFVVDLQGEGITSRAVIRKGCIIFCDNLSQAGQTFSFFDEDGVPITADQGLKVWMKKTPMDLTGNSFTIDYSENENYNQIIASVGSYAQNFSKQMQIEKYKFDVGYLFNAESFVVGKKAKIVLHARLSLHNTSMSLELLKNTSVKVTVTNNQGIKTFFSFDFPKWNPSGEQTIDFPLQSYTQNINIAIETRILLQNKKEITLTHGKDIGVDLGEKTTNFLDFYLERDINQSYTLNLMGANGESIPHSDVIVSYMVNGVEEVDRKQLKTNEGGQISLGNLSIVKKISAEINSSQARIRRVWQIDQVESSLNYNGRISIKVGQTITLPIDPSWTHSDLLLLKTYDRYYFSDESSKLIIEQSKVTTPVFDMDGLYIFRILPLDKIIEINVLKDVKWASDTEENQAVLDQLVGAIFQIRKNSYQAINIKKISFQQGQAATKATVQLDLAALSPQKQENVRVHVLASNFITPEIGDLFKTQDFNVNTAVKFNYLRPNKSVYFSNKLLSDQGAYVFNRQKESGSVGNNLEKPSLFLKRMLVRETQTKNEELDDEHDYREECAMMEIDRNLRNRVNINRAEKGSKSVFNTGAIGLNSHNNFLLLSGDVASNLKGNSFTVDIPEGYSEIEVIVLTPESAIKKSYPLGYVSSRKTKDLRHSGLNEAPEKADKSGWTMSREIYSLQEGESKTVSRDSQWRTIGLSDIFDFANTKRIKLYEWNNHLLNWHSYSEQKKREIYDKECCHELNTFLKFKDRPFFDSVVAKFISSKISKTFVDLCLLSHPSIVEYASISKLIKLNSFEKAILVYELVQQKHKKEAQFIVDALELQQKSIKRNYEEFKNNFDTIINAKESEVKEKLKKQMESMSRRRMDEESRGERMMMRAAPMMMMSMESSIMPNAMMQRDMRMKEEKKVFVPVESTKEYTERTYYNVKNYKAESLSLVPSSPFWAELSRFFLNGKTSNFLSQTFMSFRAPIEFILAAAFISSENSSNLDLSNSSEGYKVTAQVPFMLYVKEVRQMDYIRKFGVLINQRFIDPANKFSYEEDGTEIEKEVEEFIVRKPYIAQTVVTNTSGTALELQVLLDIPKGTIPLKSHEYTQITNISINSFSSLSFERFFYAPTEGVFPIYPSNACRGSTIISKAVQQPPITVKTNFTINKLQSFSDILRSGDKTEIIKFIQERNIFDSNIFKPDQILWMLKEKEFYTEVITKLRERRFYNENIWNFGFLHEDVQTIKEFVGLNVSENLDASVFEYFPYYSSRTHQFANENKSTIRNVELKQTYIRFLLTSIVGLQKQSELQVSLCYYLILQDRFREAQQLLQKISPEDYAAHEIQIDYMKCFLDMSLNTHNFTEARDIVKKYENYPIESWKKLFAEVSKTLATGQEDLSDFGVEKKTEEYQTQVLQENGQFKIIQPAETRITVEIFELNMELYYSTFPFAQISTFTSIRPSKELSFQKKAETSEIVIKRSDYPNIKDATVEVTEYKEGLPPKSISIFTWSNPEVRVKINENQGTLQVFVNKKRAIGSYVKVFSEKERRKVFYRDGYTDMTGSFKYAMSDLNGINEFSIFVSTERGGVIHKVKPPSRLGAF